MERKNMFFIVWMVIVFASVLVIIFAVTNKVEAVPNETQKPLTTKTPVPTASATISPSDNFAGEIPRGSQVSLNPNIAFTQLIGGSGSDVLSGVITLDTYYLFGTTTSASGDFKASGDADAFVAKVGMNGELVGTYTIENEGNDILLNAKPYSKLAEGGKSGIVFVTQKDGEKDEITITKVSGDLESEYKTDIKFDGNVTVVSVIHSADNLILHVNIENGSELYSEILYISYDLQNIKRHEVRLTTEFKIVQGYSMGTKQILLVNLFEEDKNSIGVLEYDTKTEEIVLNRFSGNYQTAIAMTPKSTGGFLIEYNYIENSVNKYGVLAVSNKYAIEFDHVITGGDYINVEVVEDYKQSNSTGYYLFATKKVNGTYETFSEYICTHGDLIYVNTSFLSDMLPKKFHMSESGMAVIGEVVNNNQTDLAMVSATINGEVERNETYGGSGEEAYVFSIVNREGKLAVFTSSLSSDGDLPTSFGKSDIFMLEICS